MRKVLCARHDFETMVHLFVQCCPQFGFQDYLNYLCITPNCGSKISEIVIFDQNAVISKEVSESIVA